MSKQPFNIEAYTASQQAIVQLKTAILTVLKDSPEGMKATEISRRLGVNADDLGDSNGWIVWTVLHMLQSERVTTQEVKGGPWKIDWPV
jgi:DNA-binding IclR family transcriptional regulator